MKIDWVQLFIGTIFGALLSILFQGMILNLWEIIISTLFGKNIEKIGNNWMSTFEEWDPSKHKSVETKANIILKQWGSSVWGYTKAKSIRYRRWFVKGKIHDNRYFFAEYRDSNTRLFRGCLILAIEGPHKLNGVWMGIDEDYTKDTSKPVFVGTYVFDKI
jgi:hypothetical protein